MNLMNGKKIKNQDLNVKILKEKIKETEGKYAKKNPYHSKNSNLLQIQYDCACALFRANVLVGLVCVPIEHFVTIDESKADPEVYA